MLMDKVIVALADNVGKGEDSEGKAKRDVIWRRLTATGRVRRLIDTLDVGSLADHIQDMVQDSQDVSRKDMHKKCFSRDLPRGCLLPRLRSEPSVVGTTKIDPWNYPMNGMVMLNGMVLLEAAQHLQDSQTHFGVKSTIGKRPRMEDTHFIAPNFMRIPLCLEGTQEVLPDYLHDLHGVERAGSSGNTDWGTDRERLRALYGGNIQCVFDDFHMFILCDGHGGDEVSSYCTDNVQRNLEKALNEHLKHSFGDLLSLCMDAPKRYAQDKKQDSSESAETVLCQESAHKDVESRTPTSVPPNASCKDAAEGTNQSSNASPAEVAGTSMQGGHSALEAFDAELRKLKIGFTPDAIAKSMMQSFEWLNQEVLKENLGEVQGSTMVMALVGAWFICIAGCGDSRGVLCRGGSSIRVTRDHKPDLEDEKVRIGEEGGFVIDVHGCSRVNGILAMTRAIGDHTFKGITPAPEVAVFHRSQQDEFLILASDGLWDVIGDEEACNVAKRALLRAENMGAAPEVAARAAASVLMKAAMNRGSGDNITVIVIDLRQSCTHETKAPKRAKFENDN